MFWELPRLLLILLARLLSTVPQWCDQAHCSVQKSLEVQVKSRMFDRSDPITILSFHAAFQMSSAMNGIHESDPKQLIQFFWNTQAVPTSGSEHSLICHVCLVRRNIPVILSGVELIKNVIDTKTTEDIFTNDDDQSLTTSSCRPSVSSIFRSCCQQKSCFGPVHD